jgi:hypothetical protein
MNFAELAHYPIEPYAEIKRWFSGLKALPSWQKTLTQQGATQSVAAA